MGNWNVEIDLHSGIFKGGSLWKKSNLCIVLAGFQDAPNNGQDDLVRLLIQKLEIEKGKPTKLYQF